MDKNQVLSYIADLEKQYNIPTGAFKQIVSQESRFKPGLTSSAGAYGYAQLMPATAHDMGVNRYDPMQNLEGGAKYYGSILHNQAKGDPAVAAAMYNSGPNAKFYKTNNMQMMPAETRNYMATFKKEFQPTSKKMTVEDLLSQGFTEEVPSQPKAQSNTVKPMTVEDLLSQGFTEEQPTEQPQVTAPSTDRTLGSAIAEGASNIPSSFVKNVENLYSAVSHPIETAKSLGNIAKGEAQLGAKTLGYPGVLGTDQQAQEYAAGFNQELINRYGSEQGFYNALATDPVGVAADLYPGTRLLKKGAKAVLTPLSKDAAIRDAQIANPSLLASTINLAEYPVKALANPLDIASNVLGGAENLVSYPLSIIGGVAQPSLAKAFEAGKSSPFTVGLKNASPKQKAFLEGKRGDVSDIQVVNNARDALSTMRQELSNDYRTRMAALPQANDAFDVIPVNDAFAHAVDIGTHRGFVKNPSVIPVQNQIRVALDEFNANTAIHDIRGADALKQRIGDIRDSTDPHTPERRFANEIYSNISSDIRRQSPVYGDIMDAYSRQITEINNIQKELSLGENTNPGTALRKLQSVMRNNANTSYGYRGKIAETLADKGATGLLYSIAGQDLSSWLPRGLAKSFAIPSSLIAGNVLGFPAALAEIALSSPRISGSVANVAGKTAGLLETGSTAANIMNPKQIPLPKQTLWDYLEQKDKENQ